MTTQNNATYHKMTYNNVYQFKTTKITQHIKTKYIKTQYITTQNTGKNIGS